MGSRGPVVWGKSTRWPAEKKDSAAEFCLQYHTLSQVYLSPSRPPEPRVVTGAHCLDNFQWPSAPMHRRR